MNLQKSTIFASLQSSTGIQSEQLDASMRTNMELEKHIKNLEKDNLRLMSILRGYGYEESDQQRDLLLADYTPPAGLKLSRQLDVMMLMNGLGRKDQKLVTDYIEGRSKREDIEHLAKRFILKTSETEEEETETQDAPENPETEGNQEVSTEKENFRLVEKPSPQLLTKLSSS